MTPARSRISDTKRLLFGVGYEDTFIVEPFAGRRALDEYELTQHYENWAADLGLAVEAGADYARWGIPWYCVNPERGVWDFAWIDEVADRFRELGLRPVIDLMHYGTPLWLEGSFANPDYPRHMADYAARIAERYGDVFRAFTPLNEPLLNAIYCGEFGIWPPHLTGDRGFTMLLERLGRGIVECQAAIAEVSGGEAEFVHVEASYRFAGETESFPDEVAFLRERQFVVEDLVAGRIGQDHPLASWLLTHGFAEESLAWHRDHVAPPDVMGVNYYPQVSTEAFVSGARVPAGTLDDPRPRVDEGTEGLVDVLSRFWQRYQVPVMLTETSVAGDAAAQTRWLDTSVATVHRLRSEGMPILGYTWWAVLDWYTWNYREQRAPLHDYVTRQGLWSLVPEADGSLRRVRTSTVDRFRGHAAASLELSGRR